MLPTQSVFPLQIAEEDGRFTVRFPTGTALTGANSEEFASELLAVADRTQAAQLLVDLGGITVLTSVILGKFIALNGKVRAGGGKLTLVNATPVVRQIFKVTRLDTILEFQDTANPIPA